MCVCILVQTSTGSFSPQQPTGRVSWKNLSGCPCREGALFFPPHRPGFVEKSFRMSVSGRGVIFPPPQTGFCREIFLDVRVGKGRYFPLFSVISSPPPLTYLLWSARRTHLDPNANTDIIHAILSSRSRHRKRSRQTPWSARGNEYEHGT